MCCLQETRFSFKDKNRLKVYRWKRYIMQIVTKRELEWLYYNIRKQTVRQKLLLETKKDTLLGQRRYNKYKHMHIV